MKVTIQRAVWYQDNLTPDSVEAIELLGGTWREACGHFAAATETKRWRAVLLPQSSGLR